MYIFPNCFYLIIVISHSIVNMFQANDKEVRAISKNTSRLLVTPDEVLTGFEHNYIATKGKISALDT